eukprot:2687362-Rhodomonas_salina.3
MKRQFPRDVLRNPKKVPQHFVLVFLSSTLLVSQLCPMVQVGAVGFNLAWPFHLGGRVVAAGS